MKNKLIKYLRVLYIIAAILFISTVSVLISSVNVEAKEVSKSDLKTVVMATKSTYALYIPKNTPTEAWSTPIYFSNGTTIVPLKMDWFIKYYENAGIEAADYDKDGKEEVVIHYDYMGGTGLTYEVLAYVEDPESATPSIKYYCTGDKDWVEEPDASLFDHYLISQIQAVAPRSTTKISNGKKEKVTWGHCCRIWLYSDKILLEARPENSMLLIADDVADASFDISISKTGVPSVKYLKGRYAPETLLNMAIAHFGRHNTGKMPDYSVIEYIEPDGSVAIHFYDIVGESGLEHTGTYGWYYINPTTAKGVDITEQPIDLNK